MIVLYHGTNVEFHAPDVDAGRSGMDFGKGFYLTPNLESAKFMAKRVKRLKTAGEEIVLKFAFDEKAAAESGIRQVLEIRGGRSCLIFRIAFSVRQLPNS